MDSSSDATGFLRLAARSGAFQSLLASSARSIERSMTHARANRIDSFAKRQLQGGFMHGLLSQFYDLVDDIEVSHPYAGDQGDNRDDQRQWRPSRPQRARQ